MFVACSTLCFGKETLEDALRRIGELRFAKVDLSIDEDGPHLRPSQVAADVNRSAQFLKSKCPLGLAAFHVRISATDPAEHDRQFKALCRLARIAAVPVVTLPAPSLAESFDTACQRIGVWNRIAQADGVILTIETLIGTHTESPESTVELCERIPELGVALDPTHYLVGPARIQSFDEVYPYVQHVRLRDTGAGPNEFQVRVGQGQVDYGRIVGVLERMDYKRSLTVDIRDIPDGAFAIEPEVRKLKYLLESLV